MSRVYHSVRDEVAHRLGRVTLTPLRGGPGQRNHLFVATSDAGRWVVKARVDPADDAEREAWALRTLAGAGAPRLVDSWALPPRKRELSTSATPRTQAASKTGGGVVMTWVPGRALGRATGERHLVLVARALADLHRHAPRQGPGLMMPSSPAALLRYALELAASVTREGVLPPALRTRIKRAMRHAVRHVHAQRPGARRTPRVLCHGDLCWHNLRKHGDAIVLLDFELSGLGDPAVDLALMVCRTPLSAAATERLLSAYLSARNDRTLRSRFAAVLPLVGLVSALSAVQTTFLVAGKKSSRRERSKALVELERALVSLR